MADRSLIPRLSDIVEAIERVRGVMGNVTVEAFEADWERRWLGERGVEIISEASRHLTAALNPRMMNRRVAQNALSRSVGRGKGHLVAKMPPSSDQPHETKSRPHQRQGH